MNLCKSLIPIAIVASIVLAAERVPAAENSWSAIVSPDNSLVFHFAQSDTPAFRLGLGGWGPSWAWVGLSAKDKATDEKLVTQIPFVVNRSNGQVIDVKFTASKAGPRSVVLRYDLSAAKDVPLTMLIGSLGVEPPVAKGKIMLEGVDGKQSTLKLPLGRAAGPVASKATLEIDRVGQIGITLDPPCPIGIDGDLRIMLASEVFKRGSRSVTITLTFPADVAFLAKQSDLDRMTKTLAGPDWFAFKPTDAPGPSVIGMNDWLDKPAGKHGGVRTKGDHFELEDGTPIKFWGLNLSYGGGCAPSKKDGEFTAARYAKYGVNGVRLHKFSYPKNAMGIADNNDATKMDPEGLDRLDYFSAQMKKQGVYFGWSHTYGFHVCPGNRSRLAAYDEIAKNLKGNTYAFINFAEDVQDLMIEMVVNLLGHKNPYTGTTYAEEPALSFIELQNEDDIFFYTSANAFNACPTYQKLFIQRFSDWLKAKYGSQEAFKKAWGDALKPDETLAARNIVPQTNPWFFSDGHLPGQKGGQRVRLLDNAEFLHDAQNKFYDKFVKAIRTAGYKGPLCGSPWQAPSMLPHYYNLRSDYLAGYIDRHNYFGGGLMDSMLTQPGSGYFSTGLQQLIDRPFGLSEWIHVYPSLYSAEGPAIIAAYGMGLQGWDASYEFQSQSAGRMMNDRVGWFPWGVWEADVPTQIGQFPALARMIYRGDVKESEPISVRRVSLDDLKKGLFNFSDKVEQKGDVKSFTGSVPPETLAAGRAVVEFVDTPQKSTFPDADKYAHRSGIVSSTQQLLWDTSGKGLIAINTPGTKAVVGFPAGKPIKLDEVTIEAASPYVSIFLTALDKQTSLAKARGALLTAVARNCNSGFRYFALDNKVIDNGKAPILLEPVKATVRIAGRTVKAVNVLDHDGRRTRRGLSVKDGEFTIDGARDQTMYYEVVFE